MVTDLRMVLNFLPSVSSHASSHIHHRFLRSLPRLTAALTLITELASGEEKIETVTSENWVLRWRLHHYVNITVEWGRASTKQPELLKWFFPVRHKRKAFVGRFPSMNNILKDIPGWHLVSQGLQNNGVLSWMYTVLSLNRWTQFMRKEL